MKHLNAFRPVERPNAITHTPWLPNDRKRARGGGATVTVTITTTTVSATATAAGAAADALPLPIDTLTHKSTLLFIDFHICPLCACFYPMCVCHFIKSLSGPCGPQTRSCLPTPPPLYPLVIYLNLCDFNEIGSLLEHNQSDSTRPSQRFINRLKMFSSSLLFVCILCVSPFYSTHSPFCCPCCCCFSCFCCCCCCWPPKMSGHK